MTQLQAIIGSCLKWWRIRYQGVADYKAANCPLCKWATEQCGVCPVQREGCGGTPWSTWVKHARLTTDKNDISCFFATTLKAEEAASAELQFLFDLIKPRYYRNVEKELNKGDYPKKFRAWMLRAIAKKEA